MSTYVAINQFYKPVVYKTKIFMFLKHMPINSKTK